MFKIKNIKFGRNGSYNSLPKAIHYAYKKAEEFYTDLTGWRLSDFSVYTKEWENVRYVYVRSFAHNEDYRFAEIHTL